MSQWNEWRYDVTVRVRPDGETRQLAQYVASVKPDSRVLINHGGYWIIPETIRHPETTNRLGSITGRPVDDLLFPEVVAWVARRESWEAPEEAVWERLRERLTDVGCSELALRGGDLPGEHPTAVFAFISGRADESELIREHDERPILEAVGRLVARLS